MKSADEVAVYLRGGWVKLVPSYDAFLQSGEILADNYRAVSLGSNLVACHVLTIPCFDLIATCL